MSRDPKLRLEDIVECCERLEQYMAGYDWPAFSKDTKTQDAVARVFEIIGEAVKCLPDTMREREPDIPWRLIAGFRDVLAHSYFNIEAKVVWEAASEKAPVLKQACLRLLK